MKDPQLLNRRQLIGDAAASVLVGSGFARSNAPTYRLATFTAEVTCPLGHPLMGGGIAPAKEIVDPLFAHGFVLLGSEKPLVLCAVDWCEIRNDAYDRWRGVLSDAVGTTPERVLLTCVHQHDAPIADLEAERILRVNKCKGSICDLEFHERTVQRVARAAREALSAANEVTHIGTGQCKVEKVASNRRYLSADGKPQFGRMSATRDPDLRTKPEGLIDPLLKTLSFWNGTRPLAAVSFYATHPMSHYGRGGVSADFVGLARKRRQADEPKVHQIYCSGCSGNVTAGKYNDGSTANRPILAERMYRAMSESWQATQRYPLSSVKFRSLKMRLEARDQPGHTVKDLQSRLRSGPRPFGQCLAALGLSWRKRADAGHCIDVPAIDFGAAQLVLLPAESYVEYQLYAQQLRPDSFVAVAGYGDCAPGYVPTDRHFAERDSNLSDWCWVAPGSEKVVKDSLRAALSKP